MADRIHVIDPDYRRRARVSSEFSIRNVHVEIYEDLAEFRHRNPCEGFIFAADHDEESCDLSKVVEAVKECGTALPIVVYGRHPATRKVVSAMLSGALDYLEWPFDPQALGLTFQRLATEGVYRVMQEQRRSVAKAQVGLLTPREKQVLVRIADGLSNKETALMLQISPRTVEIHRGNMMRKLNAQSAADVVRIALYAGVDEDIRFAA